jgi:AcrR family transcriptional regulator
MTQQTTRTGRKRESGRAPVRRRLTAEARKSSILKAARSAFTATGDMNGTTIRVIAEKGGISEGVIYRHFESKDQLFFEAVVAPLRDAVDELIAATEIIDRDEPLTPQRALATTHDLYRQLEATLEEVLPLLGLVLFGDPKVARRFYRDYFAVAMDRLAAAWQTVGKRQGLDVGPQNLTARAVMGMAMMLALESRHGQNFDRDRGISHMTEGTINGFYPQLGARLRRRG